MGFLMLLILLGCGKQEGSRAPGFSLNDLDGQKITLEQNRGSVVLVDFWATWCPPCRVSIPELVDLQSKYRDRGLVILGISLDDPGRTTDQFLRAFKQKFKINYRVLRFNHNVIKAYFKHETPSIPTLFVIDREGRIKDKIVGFRPGAVEASITKVL